MLKKKKKDLCQHPASPRTVAFSAPDLSAGHCQPTSLHQRLLDTHRQVWLSLLWGHCCFSWVLVHTRFHCALWESVSLEVLSPFADPQVGKSVMGSRTVITVQELLLYNCSLVCGLSAQRLYSVANGDLLQEDLCHTPHLSGLLQPGPLSPL